MSTDKRKEASVSFFLYGVFFGLTTIYWQFRFTSTQPLKFCGLCNMTSLQELDLSGNNFIGTLYPCLGNLTSLRALDLSYNLLSGIIPSSFTAKLESLEYLSLSYNNFEGLFSLSSLANNSRLKLLSLAQMKGDKFQVETESPPWIPSFQLEFLQMPHCRVNLPAITTPSFLSYQQSLEFIDLSFNNLAGKFPNWLLLKNPKLKGVLLNGNYFIGSLQLSSDLNQHMDQLRIFDISDNKLQGDLPKNMGNIFRHLEILNVSMNKFHGEIPASVGEMSYLNVIDLSYNNFSGQIPILLLERCVSLNILRLSNNSLQGQIVLKPVNLVYLKLLMLDNNNFSGTLQDGLLSLESLRVLDISNNKLSGTLPRSFMIGMQLQPLQFLSVSRNNLEGGIPDGICELTLMTLIDLSHNKFSGEIPSCSDMFTPKFIHLQGNNLTGSIPEWLLRSPELISLDLRENRISGGIPKRINLRGMKFLLLAGNRFQGFLPSQLCHLKELNFLDLSRNNFTGSLPLCFNNMSFGNQGSYINFAFSFEGLLYGDLFTIVYQYLHFYVPGYSWDDKQPVYYVPEQLQFLTKSLSLWYKGDILNYMSGIDLSCNQLTGEIPKTIGELQDLHALNLSHNHLSGTIPESFRNLKSVESLDLSYNNLSGKIPLQLQELNSLSFFNVSYNNLSGTAPDQGQFGSFDESSYIGNPHLFVNNSNRGVQTPPRPTLVNGGEEREFTIDLIAFCWSFGASYVTILLMLVTILWINPYWRRRWFYFIKSCLYKCLGQYLGDGF